MFRTAAQLLLVALAFAPAARAQTGAPGYAAGGQGEAASPLAGAAVVRDVRVDQKLGEQVPLDLTFRDESGATVKLSDYFGKKKPVVLALVYYGCPSLCTMTLNGLTASFKPLSFNIGDEFEVLTVSFDPSETPQLASEKKAAYMKSYGRPGADKGWHFLTGDENNIRALTDAVGFRYAYDPNTKQFAHASAIMVLTPQGKLARYFYGLEYSSRDLRLGMIEASEEKIGTASDAVTLICFQYDPRSGKYGWAVMTLVRTAGVLTVLTIGTFVFFMLRRDRKHGSPATSTVERPATVAADS